MFVLFRREVILIFGNKMFQFFENAYRVIKRDGWKTMFTHGNYYLLCTFGPAYMSVLGRLYCNRKKIIFKNFAGRGYGDNPKYIAKELLARNEGYDLVWIVQAGSNYMFPKGIRTVRHGTWRELYELSTAKFWIDNNRKAKYIVKNKKQCYIQTWHGLFALKKIEKDAESFLSESYIEAAKHDSYMTDLMISGCEVMSNLYKTSFWYGGETVGWGNPRNDIFFNRVDYKNLICEHFNIDLNKKLVLYAPTFRDNHSITAYNLDYSRLLKNLEAKFGGSWVCLIRLHPAVRERNKDLSYAENCIDTSLYDDIQELLSAVDMLITDYSSCMFEYALRKQPVILYASDIAEYMQGRGFYYDINALPFPLSKDNDELAQTIHFFDESCYLQKVEEFFEEIVSYECGNASKLTVDYIIANT